MIVKRKALLGPEPKDDKKVRGLGRIMEFHNGVKPEDSFLQFEPDPRHAEISVKQLNLDGPRTKGVVTPGTKSVPKEQDKEITTEAKSYRSACMRANYLAVDLPHLQFSRKEAAKTMSVPKESGLEKVKMI